MLTNFQLLFSVRVVHNYFENDICSCLQFSPNETSQNMLKKYGLKLRNTINGFNLFYGSDIATAGLLNTIKTTSGQGYFEFDIISTDPNFVFFTELPVDRLWQMEYESHDPLNSAEDNSIALHLTLTEQKNPPVIGNLKIYVDDILGHVGKTLPANYIIRLKARTTQWQYYVINKSSVPLGHPSISGKTNTSFKGPENVTLENGEEALFFYSDQADLPLSQVPIFRFDLVNSGAGDAANTTKESSNTRIILKGLPNPDPAHMRIVLIDGKMRATSPMYIYI
jgi:hypothetical protein